MWVLLYNITTTLLSFSSFPQLWENDIGGCTLGRVLVSLCRSWKSLGGSPQPKFDTIQAFESGRKVCNTLPIVDGRMIPALSQAWGHSCVLTFASWIKWSWSSCMPPLFFLTSYMKHFIKCVILQQQKFPWRSIESHQMFLHFLVPEPQKMFSYFCVELNRVHLSVIHHLL